MLELSGLAAAGWGPYDAVLPARTVLGVVAAREASGTELLEALGGLRRHAGRVWLAGRLRRRGDAALAPEQPELILFGRTAAEAIGPGAREFARRLGVGELLGRPPQELSGGERRRLALAAAFGSGRPLLLLDRPTAGLDPDGQAALWQLLGEWPGVAALTLRSAAEAARCTVLLALPGRSVWPGGPLSATRQRSMGWPPDAAADLAWSLGIEDKPEEVAAWRPGRRPSSWSSPPGDS